MKFSISVTLALLLLLLCRSVPGAILGGNEGPNKPYEIHNMEFRIDTTWDGDYLNEDDTIITLKSLREDNTAIIMEVSAPFFNSPPSPPGGRPGEPYFKLWDYEVVEAFFMGSDNRYLEVELGPHGQHLLLLLDGHKNSIKHSIPIKYAARIDDDFWSGQARIPSSYFPPNVTMFNAYAISGEGQRRTYKALSPTPKGKYSAPDFHRLEYFEPIDFGVLLPANKDAPLSSVWKGES